MASQISHVPSRSEQTRALLWNCAVEEFASNGPDRARVSDIVRRAGVTQPTFYAYFETKDDAYAAMISSFRKRLKQLNEVSQPSDAPGATLTERVAQNLTALLDFLAEDRHLTRIGLFQSAAAPGSRAILARSITATVAREQEAGLIRSDIPAARIGQLYVGIIEQLAREAASPRRRAEQALDCARMICEGLRPA